MDEMQTSADGKNKKILSVVLMLVLTVGAVIAVVMIFRKPQLVSPLVESEEGVRVIFVSPEPSRESLPSPTASASASLKATPKPTPKATPQTTPVATPKASASPVSTPSPS